MVMTQFVFLCLTGAVSCNGPVAHCEKPDDSCTTETVAATTTAAADGVAMATDDETVSASVTGAVSCNGPVTTCEKPAEDYTAQPDADTAAAAAAGVAMATDDEPGEVADPARCEEGDADDDAGVIAAASDCLRSQSDVVSVTLTPNNNNNDDDDDDIVVVNKSRSQRQSPPLSPCCALDATRLSATTFHADAAVSRASDAAQFTPGQYGFTRVPFSIVLYSTHTVSRRAEAVQIHCSSILSHLWSARGMNLRHGQSLGGKMARRRSKRRHGREIICLKVPLKRGK